MTAVRVHVPGPAPVPQVRLLDAREVAADEEMLRGVARRLTESAAAPWVSRSYAFPYALIAWHDAPVGIDIERIERCSMAFAEMVCTPSEMAFTPADGPVDDHLTGLWSSKEALAKALGDALRYDPRRLGSPMYWPEGRAGTWCTAALRAPAGHCAWICWRGATPATDPARVAGRAAT